MPSSTRTWRFLVMIAVQPEGDATIGILSNGVANVRRLCMGTRRANCKQTSRVFGVCSNSLSHWARRSATGWPTPADWASRGAALIFAVGLAVVAGLYVCTNMSRVLLFWAAFILTRPFGATVGDFLDKPMNQSGLAISRPLASEVITAAIVVCLIMLPQRAGRHPEQLVQVQRT
jgi:hypothetical protein